MESILRRASNTLIKIPLLESTEAVSPAGLFFVSIKEPLRRAEVVNVLEEMRSGVPVGVGAVRGVIFIWLINMWKCFSAM